VERDACLLSAATRRALEAAGGDGHSWGWPGAQAALCATLGSRASEWPSLMQIDQVASGGGLRGPLLGLARALVLSLGNPGAWGKEARPYPLGAQSGARP
jgi:hypothetical protein